MSKQKKSARTQKPKRTYAKPVSLYGIPFEEAVEGLLQTEPPKKRKPKQKKK